MRQGWLVVLLASCGFPRPADVEPMDGGDGAGGDGSGTTDCELTAISPAIASSNDTVTLEGTFLGSVTVNLPGAAPRPATVIGLHRATVVVPADATSGDLTVTACNATLGPLPFRHVTFVVGVANPGAMFDQSSIARQTPKLSAARASSAATVAGRYVYVIGGADSSGSLASVEQAMINADGSLMAFSRYASTSLAAARQGHTVAVLGGYLYVLGGAGSDSLDSIERATLTRDGALGPFALVSDVKLAARRRGHASVVIGDGLYVLGGSDGAPLDSVERAAIKPDGSLAAFATVPGVHLAIARHGHTAVVVGSYLYLAGGTGNAGALDNVERAPINPDGTLGPFSLVAGVTLPTPRSGHSAIVLGGVLYLIGGSDGSGPLSSIVRAAFDASGLLGAFTTLPEAMLTARQGHATAVVGNQVYALGGVGAGTLDSVEWTTLVFNGELPAPAEVVSVTFVAARSEATAVAIGSYVYMIGGATNGANTIERATVGADGALSSFATVDGISLTTPRRRHTAAVIGKSLYVIGGTGAAGPVKTIERATINADGSLGSFADAGSLAAVRTEHSSVVIRDSVFVIGGADTAGLLGTIERATINADGSLGSFATVPGVALKTARQGHHNVAIRNTLYVLGGDTDSIEQAAINSDGSLGAFATVGNALLRNDARFEATCTPVGKLLHVIGGDTSGTLSQGLSEHGNITAAGSLTSFGFSPVGAVLRSGHSTIVLGNYLYILGGLDMNGSPAGALSVLLSN